MIGWLTGKLVKKNPPNLLLNVQGVGYELEVSMTTFYTLGDLGEEIQLYTHLAIRDDAHLLFGFSTERERQLFRDLIKVNGIGAKVALAILSGMAPADFIICIQNGDRSKLTTLPGVGNKTAQRLIVEMRDRINIPSEDSDNEIIATNTVGAANEALNALQSLGYKLKEANRLVALVNKEGMDSEKIIREALKSAVK